MIGLKIKGFAASTTLRTVSDMMRVSWAIQTNCAECDADEQLSSGLCHACRVSMGYEIEEES